MKKTKKNNVIPPSLSDAPIVTKNKAVVRMHEFDDTDIPPGQVRRKVGDIFMYGRYKYVVENVSPSHAVARCQEKIKRTEVDPKTGDLKQLDPAPLTISISNCCDRGDVIGHIKGYQATPKTVTDTDFKKDESITASGGGKFSRIEKFFKKAK